MFINQDHGNPYQKINHPAPKNNKWKTSDFPNPVGKTPNTSSAFLNTWLFRLFPSAELSSWNRCLWQRLLRNAWLGSNGPIRVANEATYLNLRSGRWHGVGHKHIRKAEEANFKPNFSFFTSLSTTEAHVCGEKFIRLYETVAFIAIRDFSFWGESDLWSDVWPAIDEVVCLSLLLEGETTISNNFTKRRQNSFKIGTRDKYATHLR